MVDSTVSVPPDRLPAMSTIKKGMPKVSPFAQMLRDKREKLAPNATLREFCASRGFETPVIDGMERDRRTAPGTFSALYKLASGYGHSPTDRWTMQLLDAALGKAPAKPAVAKQSRRAGGRSTAAGSAARKASPARRASSAGGASSRPGSGRRKGAAKTVTGR